MKLVFNDIIFSNYIDDGSINLNIGELGYNESIVTDFSASVGKTYLVLVISGRISNQTRIYINGYPAYSERLPNDEAVEFSPEHSGKFSVVNKESGNNVDDLVLQIREE